eukprot:763342-Hanusia_phi.AAC.1
MGGTRIQRKRGKESVGAEEETEKIEAPLPCWTRKSRLRQELFHPSQDWSTACKDRLEIMLPPFCKHLLLVLLLLIPSLVPYFPVFFFPHIHLSPFHLALALLLLTNSTTSFLLPSPSLLFIVPFDYSRLSSSSSILFRACNSCLLLPTAIFAHQYCLLGFAHKLSVHVDQAHVRLDWNKCEERGGEVWREEVGGRGGGGGDQKREGKEEQAGLRDEEERRDKPSPER